MDLEEKKCWIGFNVFEGIGPLRFKLLYDFFGSAKTAFNAPGEKLREVGLSENLVNRFLEFRKTFDIDSYIVRLTKQSISVLCSEEESYPKLLKQIVGKPPLIYVKKRVIPTNPDVNREYGACLPAGRESLSNAPGKGSLDPSTPSITLRINSLRAGPARDDKKNIRDDNDIFDKKAIAVVGTRKITGYGRQVTEMITEGLVNNGLVIVSGLARGVDKIAHETTINNKGLTIGVLGCGLDMIYPPEHKPLADKIVETGGAVISEFPLGMQAVPGNFPARNRIISGLSLGVVVTEAAEDSGSLITASDAAEQGREVFAVPGPITSPLSGGTSALMKKGAKVVTGVNDILEELGIAGGGKNVGAQHVAPENEEERKIVDLLENENLHIDEIARKLGNDSGTAGGILSLLEIKGIVRGLGEGIYSLR